MKLFRTKTPAALDNPSRWNQYLKPWFDEVRFQDQINQRVGLNRDGKPLLRLVWGQNVWQRMFKESTPRYWTRRLRKEYWTVPRWILERRMEPEQYMAAWEQKRYAMEDPRDQYCVACGCGDIRIIEVPSVVVNAAPKLVNTCERCGGTTFKGRSVDRGEAPKEYYIFSYLIAEHSTHHINGWPQCCDISYHTDRSRCWGKYRQPNDDDLDLVSQAMRAMEADKFIDPYAPLTLSQLVEAELAANKQVERAQLEFEEYERSMIRDFNKLHGHRIFEGPNSFHDLGGNFNKQADSGLYIPEGG